MLTYTGSCLIVWGFEMAISGNQNPIMKHQIYEWFGDKDIDFYTPFYYLGS